ASHAALTSVGGMVVAATAVITIYGASHLNNNHDTVDVGSPVNRAPVASVLPTGGTKVHHRSPQSNPHTTNKRGVPVTPGASTAPPAAPPPTVASPAQPPGSNGPSPQPSPGSIAPSSQPTDPNTGPTDPTTGPTDPTTGPTDPTTSPTTPPGPITFSSTPP